MEKRRDLTQPSLTLMMYGSAQEKRWQLNLDVATLGRAKGCDIVLDAPDISSLHCIVCAFQGGYLVRDCGSRAGTQLNGDRVNQATLHDGDILQVGPFSFRLTLPTGPAKAGRREERCKHLERSRRNLGRLAWAQRKKLLELQQAASGDSEPALVDLNQKASGLRHRFRDFEKRSRQLEQGERELSLDREAFNQERKDHLARLKETEQEISCRKQEIQTDLEARRQELLKQEEIMIETRNHQTQASALLEQQRQAQEQAEKSLREQRTELVRMMADLRQMHDAIRGQKNVDVEALRQENERLRIELSQSVHHAADDPSAKLVEEIKELQEENQRLRQLLQEQRDLMEELKTAPTTPRENVDLDQFEGELNRYRQQLEADRQKLDEEKRQIKVRDQELDEATREMEMEFSRERAELARERTRLERLREEVRVESERLQRDQGVRESLASVQRLREGFTPKR